MTPEQKSQQMIEAALEHSKQKLNGKLMHVALTPEQECLERANKTMNGVAHLFSRQLKIMLRRPEYHECVEQLYKIIRQEFATWSYDDIACLACMHLAITATSKLKDEGIIA